MSESVVSHDMGMLVRISGVLKTRRDKVQVGQQEVEVGRHDVVDRHGAGVSARARLACRVGVKGCPRRSSIAQDIP